MKFELFVVVDEQNCLGFRFEPAHSEGAHKYNHIQITSSDDVFRLRGYPRGYLKAIPRSRWALASLEDLFFYMAVSVHGYEGGMERVIGEIFEDDATLKKKYLDELAEKILRNS